MMVHLKGFFFQMANVTSSCLKAEIRREKLLRCWFEQWMASWQDTIPPKFTCPLKNSNHFKVGRQQLPTSNPPFFQGSTFIEVAGIPISKLVEGYQVTRKFCRTRGVSYQKNKVFQITGSKMRFPTFRMFFGSQLCSEELSSIDRCVTLACGPWWREQVIIAAST